MCLGLGSLPFKNVLGTHPALSIWSLFRGQCLNVTIEDDADNRALIFYQDKQLRFEDDDEYGWIECPQHLHYTSSYKEFVWAVFSAGRGEYKVAASLLQERAWSFPISKLWLVLYLYYSSSILISLRNWLKTTTGDPRTHWLCLEWLEWLGILRFIV